MARTQVYPLQMTDLPNRPFDKIAIDLVSDANVSASGNQHILTIITHLTGRSEAFPIPEKKVDTIVQIFINNYLPIHMCPHFILSDNGTEFKNQVMDNVLQQLGIDYIFASPYYPQSNGKLEVFHKYLSLFVHCYKLHIHADAFLGILFVYMYINTHILDIYIYVSMYVSIYLHVCIDAI